MATTDSTRAYSALGISFCGYAKHSAYAKYSASSSHSSIRSGGSVSASESGTGTVVPSLAAVGPGQVEEEEPPYCVLFGITLALDVANFVVGGGIAFALEVQNLCLSSCSGRDRLGAALGVLLRFGTSPGLR